jgi:hypothetical protein
MHSSQLNALLLQAANLQDYLVLVSSGTKDISPPRAVAKGERSTS